MKCIKCGEEMTRDEVDVGVRVMVRGPRGCPCGWSSDPRYDIPEGPKFENGHRIDQWGGLTPS